MTTQRKAHKGAGAKGLKLKKETLKDLDPKGKASKVKGGIRVKTTIRG